MVIHKSKCERCGNRPSRDVDHIFPRRLGGGNEPFNLWRLCRECHTAKSNEFDNAHIQNGYANREMTGEKWGIQSLRRERAEDYATHIAGDCDYYDCQYCDGSYLAEKTADDARMKEIESEEHWSEELFILNYSDELFDISNRRVGVLLAYALYSSEATQWHRRLVRWLALDCIWELGVCDTRWQTRRRRFSKSRSPDRFLQLTETRLFDESASIAGAILACAKDGGRFMEPENIRREWSGIISEIIDCDTLCLWDGIAGKLKEAKRWYFPESEQSSFLDMVPVLREMH